MNAEFNVTQYLNKNNPTGPRTYGIQCVYTLMVMMLTVLVCKNPKV